MKKSYETPSVEVVKFQYRDQVVAASGISSHKCIKVNTHENDIVKCESQHYWESDD